MIAGAGLTARVHLSLSCDGLANLDVGSKSDPFVVSTSPLDESYSTYLAPSIHYLPKAVYVVASQLTSVCLALALRRWLLVVDGAIEQEAIWL